MKNFVFYKLPRFLRVIFSGDLLWRQALRHGVTPGFEHLRVLGQMKCATVIDAGANRGQFALAARHCYPEAWIFSFEPLTEPAKTFRNVFANDDKVQLHVAAIGEQSGMATIHVSAQDYSSSLLPITDLQDQLFPGTLEAETQTIKIGRLTDFLGKDDITPPALLKLDVQGFELIALKGCEEFLPLFTWVYVECSFVELYAGQALADEVIVWLKKCGFAFAGVYNMSFGATGGAIQADFLFRRAVDMKAT